MTDNTTSPAQLRSIDPQTTNDQWKRYSRLTSLIPQIYQLRTADQIKKHLRRSVPVSELPMLF